MGRRWWSNPSEPSPAGFRRCAAAIRFAESSPPAYCPRMLARVRSAVVIGVDAHPVEVEIDLSSGLPSFTTVGLPQSAVKEGRERVAAAVANSGFEFPLRRITVNLAPADVPKAGSAFDLPIAIGLLLASDQVALATSAGGAESGFLFGELSLEGALRPIRGAISVVMCARHLGARWVVLPAPNAAEGALVGDIDVFGAETLLELNGADVRGGSTNLHTAISGNSAFRKRA